MTGVVEAMHGDLLTISQQPPAPSASAPCSALNASIFLATCTVDASGQEVDDGCHVSPPKARYRALLAACPREHRQRSEDEMVAALLDATALGERGSTRSEILSIVVNGALPCPLVQGMAVPCGPMGGRGTAGLAARLDGSGSRLWWRRRRTDFRLQRVSTHRRSGRRRLGGPSRTSRSRTGGGVLCE